MKVFNDIYIQAITGSGCYTCQRINRFVTLKKGYKDTAFYPNKIRSQTFY